MTNDEVRKIKRPAKYDIKEDAVRFTLGQLNRLKTYFKEDFTAKREKSLKRLESGETVRFVHEDYMESIKILEKDFMQILDNAQELLASFQYGRKANIKGFFEE